MNRTRRRLTRPWLLGLVGAALVVATAGLYWFQPWQLWANETVQEDVPLAAAPPTSARPAPVPVPVDAPRELATGTVRILRAADGSHVLRLENLDTSSGPDVHVWLTDASVEPGELPW